MDDYKTITEKSAEWNMTSRHIQHLCRNGKIEGAIKRAGTWFIPGDVPSPAKNTKSNAAVFGFVGTKSKIFDVAVELFLTYGFDNVSLSDIASKVGIRQSTIYSHFKSKHEILDIIYDFYCYYHQKDRPSLNDMEVKLRNESPIRIIKAIRYDFKEDYVQAMSDITKIIFQRIGIDARARDIAKSLMVDEGIKYVETVFNMGIDIGRFDSFDTHAMAVFINSVRIFTLYNWIIDPTPDSMMKLLDDEHILYDYAARLLTKLSLRA